MVKVTYLSRAYELQDAVGEFYSMCEEAKTRVHSVRFEIVDDSGN